MLLHLGPFITFRPSTVLLHVSAAVPHKVKKYKQFGGSKPINIVCKSTSLLKFLLKCHSVYRNFTSVE